MHKVWKIKIHYADDKNRVHKHVFNVTPIPGENIFDTARRDGPARAKKARVARLLRPMVALAG